MMLPSMQAVLCTASARGLDSLVSWIGKASVELCSNWCEAASDLSALPGRDRNQARRPVARLQLGGLPEGWDGVWLVGVSEVWDMGGVYAHPRREARPRVHLRYRSATAMTSDYVPRVNEQEAANASSAS